MSKKEKLIERLRQKSKNFRNTKLSRYWKY